MTRVHIRTDDDVYRVDAVWLGPPRATFPWRARYSAYGVGLLVMIVIMFLQRRLGIPIGFFSIAWALLITVVVTRFVSRRINDERPLLEWLTLFNHELRGPRPRTRAIGGALGTGHVTVRRDRPRPSGQRGMAALPRGESDRAEHPAHPLVPERAGIPEPRAVRPDRVRGTRATADAQGFGPPSSADVGAPADRGPDVPRALPAPAPGPSAAAVVASWGGPEAAEPVRVTARRVDHRVRAERAPGRGPRAFGPGATRDGRAGGYDGDNGGPTGREDDGAPPVDHR